MRLFTAIIILCCSFSAVHGQITLNATDYPGVLIGTDSLRQVSYGSLLPSLGPVLGGIWDLSSASDSSAALLAYRVAVPTYQYGDSAIDRIGSFTYTRKGARSITSIGHIEQSAIVTETFHNLISITAGNDTMFIPSQNITYSTPLILAGLPCTMAGVWQSILNYDIDFQLTISMFSLTHQQFTQRRFTVRKDTVVGWGKMRVKNTAGAASPYTNVLQVQTVIYTTDSFYMGSSLSPGVYLTLLGLTQGKRDTTYAQYFYRTGEVTPLVTAQYKDAGFSTPTKVVYHHQRLDPVDADILSSSVRFAVYPNPACNELHFVTPGIDLYQYTISDISGRTVMVGKIDGVKGETGISLPGYLLSGLYHVMISESNVPVFTTRLVINR